MTGPHGAVVARRLVFELTPNATVRVPVQVALGYDPGDPLAVRAEFASGRGPVVWRLGRDLLAAGLHRPAGLGDVLVRPATRPGRIELELRSHEGRAVFAVPTDGLAEFLHETYRAVPPGGEYRDADLDIEAELLALLDQGHRH